MISFEKKLLKAGNSGNFKSDKFLMIKLDILKTKCPKHFMSCGIRGQLDPDNLCGYLMKTYTDDYTASNCKIQANITTAPKWRVIRFKITSSHESFWDVSNTRSDFKSICLEKK